MLLRTASRRVHRAPIASWLSGQLQQQRADLSSTPLDERQLQLEEKKLAEAAVQREHEAAEAAAQRKHEAAQRKHEEKKLAMQRELEEKKLATQRELEEKKLATQRELEEKKLVETAAQRELEEKKLVTQREHKERRLARHAETKCFQLTVTNADGIRTDLPEMRLRRHEWDSFQRYTTRGPLYVMSDTATTRARCQRV